VPCPRPSQLHRAAGAGVDDTGEHPTRIDDQQVAAAGEGDGRAADDRPALVRVLPATAKSTPMPLAPVPSIVPELTTVPAPHGSRPAPTPGQAVVTPLAPLLTLPPAPRYPVVAIANDAAEIGYRADTTVDADSVVSATGNRTARAVADAAAGPSTPVVAIATTLP